MRIAVLVKQVPLARYLAMGPNGRLSREGVELEMNPYCRRALAKGIELAGLETAEVERAEVERAGVVGAEVEPAGTCTVFTLGPPGAVAVLLEALAAGAHRGILISDARLAGADALVTSRCLALALALEESRDGPFDIILTGAASIDGETGLVAPMVAQLLGRPFAGVARSMVISSAAGNSEGRSPGTWLTAHCELDYATGESVVPLPAVVSAAERLCDPVKRGPDHYSHLKVDELLRTGGLAEINLARLEAARLEVEKGRLGRVSLGLLEGPFDLGRLGQVDSGPGSVGNEGSLQQATLQARELSWTDSPTQVTQVEEIERSRQPVVLSGPLEEQAARVAEFIREILGRSPQPGGAQDLEPGVMDPRNPLPRLPEEEPSPEQAKPLPRVPVLDAMIISEPGRPELESSLLEACKGLTGNRSLHAAVVRLDSAGIDEEACASAVLAYMEQGAAGKRPEIILAPNSSFGTALLARLGAALGMGVIADAVKLEYDREGIIAWKPALSGGVMAGIRSKSPIFIATFMASPLGSLVATDQKATFSTGTGPVQLQTVQLAVKKGTSSKRTLKIDPVANELALAKVVVGVGSGVSPEGYQQVDELVQLLGGVLVATRKVTDRGWLPRTRQVGLTGQAIAPDLYVVIGASGKLNHMIGAKGAKAIVAINNDPEALVFKTCDLGMVAEWKEATKALIAALRNATR